MFSQMAVNKRLKHPTTCQCCGKWLKTGLHVYKWWPRLVERDVYPTVWACNLCWRGLVDGKLKPPPVKEKVAETRAALEALGEKLVEREPVEIPAGVVAPLRKSPMNERR